LPLAAGQEIVAKHGYRPVNRVILKRYQDRLPGIALFPVALVAKDRFEAHEKFFGDNGIFEIIHLARTK
jgi:sulfate/thiosulfate transport system substrate-binding protein